MNRAIAPLNTIDRLGADACAVWRHLRPIARAAIVFAAALCVCTVIRLPFFNVDSGDDPFFLLGARLWLDGRLPYLASFDIKPPGVLAAFLLPIHYLGDSVLTLRLVMVLGDAITASALYQLGRRMGDRWIGIWAGALYPVLSVIVFNNSAYALLAPMVVSGVLMAVVSQGRKLGWVAASGLLLGSACMIKQTCAFETLVVMLFLAIMRSRPAGKWRQGARAATWFCAWAAAPGLGVCLYFASQGGLGALLTDSVTLALARSGGRPEGLDTWASLARLIRLQRYVLAPLALTALTLLRWKAFRACLPKAPLGLLASWLGVGALSVFLQHASYAGYLVAEAPPLLLLSGAGLAVVLDELKRIGQAWRVLGATVLATGLVYANAQAGNINWEDMPAQRRLATIILAQPRRKDDRLFVVNRGLWIYALSGRDPPTAYYHPMHTLCDFPGAGPLALAQDLSARPRFIVVANPSLHFVCERKARWAAIRQTLEAHYERIAHVTGQLDSFDLYETRR